MRSSNLPVNSTSCSSEPSRLRAVLVASVAVIALALEVIGLYGLLAYMVNQRRHEIGIRLALGATRQAIFAALFTQGARLARHSLSPRA